MLERLADGKWHSGEDLGRELSVTRAAISKHCRQIRELGLDLESQVGQGYKLAEPLSLLSESKIVAGLGAAPLNRLQVFPVIDSTNSHLMSASASRDVHAEVCLAEKQTAGRGRRGRHWASPFAASLYLSMAWRFDEGVAAIEGLSLAVGLEVCRALESLGFEHASLKWPNDILVGAKKLGGVLVELSGDADGGYLVVVGLGLNVCRRASMDDEIEQPWTTLADENFDVDRNVLCAAVLSRLFALLQSFPERTFAHYQGEWEARNAFKGEQVTLLGVGDPVVGHMLGIDTRGSLIVAVDGTARTFVGGELSLRRAR
jgi:BirA family biotin operon repressor/biotin-[acetyl-CoA-carboxylase] ligase